MAAAQLTWAQLDAAVADAVLRRDRKALEQALNAGGSAKVVVSGGRSALVEAARAGDVTLVNLLLRCGAPSRGPTVDSAIRSVADKESALFKALDGARSGEGVGIQECGERIRRRTQAPGELAVP